MRAFHLRCAAYLAVTAVFASGGGCGRNSASSHAAQGGATAKFVDTSEEAGLSFRQYHGGCGLNYFVEQVAAGAALFDADGDGDLDAYFPQPKPLGQCKFPSPLRQRLYLNDGNGRFTLAPAAFGGKETDYGIGAAVGDYDNDGRPDLYVSCFGKNTLYRNQGGGRFADVTHSAGISFGGFGTGAVFFDYDRDGRLDLYAMRYCEWDLQKDIPCPGPDGKRDACNPRIYQPSTNRLFHNNGDGTFTDVSERANLGRERRRSLGAAAVDFDGDGWLDLFVANDLGPNYLYQNNRNGTFREVAMQVGAAFGLSGRSQANMGVAVGDYNDSGRPSVLVSTFSGEPYTLYRNEGGFFTDVSAQAGIAEPTIPFLSFGAGFFDSRNLGRLDLFFANGHVSPYAGRNAPGEPGYRQRNQLLLNDGRGYFEEDLDALPADDVRVHRGAVFGDVNGDGRIDVLVTANDDRPTLLRNESPRANWLLLRLTDRNGCATPVGARAVARIGRRTLLRMVVGGGSYGGESDHRLHFGLGSAQKVDALEITWLSGAKQTLRDVRANQTLEIREEAP